MTQRTQKIIKRLVTVLAILVCIACYVAIGWLAKDTALRFGVPMEKSREIGVLVSVVSAIAIALASRAQSQRDKAWKAEIAAFRNHSQNRH
jgi:hypothetical protein